MTSLPLLLVVLLLVVCCPLGDAQRQNLSDIRYRFTPCGATGRSGPGLLECFSFYREQGSPIQRAIISTFNAYPGSQRLEVPRSAVYNVTIAGASGGRGVCNILTGKGLKFEFQTALTDDTDLLIIVGQKGIGPCDTDSDQINCLTPPDTLSSASGCASGWEQWLFSNYPNVSTGAIGGASGGGASVIFLFDRNSTALISPLSVAGGGGGSSAELNLTCDFLQDRCITPLDCTRAKEYFQCFLNASEEVIVDPSIEDGSRGFRIENGFVSGGAGGGLFPDPPSVVFDGASLNLDTQTEHAVGGFDCVQQLAGTFPFLNVNGGFGGGGGGCGGGGGGGGFRGGDVFEIFNYIPGGGGTSAVFNTSVESVESNDGDGFVDIVPADCNCAYQCVVDKETDEFQCLCPDSAFIAPDQFDCFREFQQNVTEATALEPFITGRGVSIQAYTIDQAVVLYSMQATLTSEEDETCAIVLFGDEDDDLRVITSRPVNSGSRTVNGVAELNTTTLSYNVFLPGPLSVTGAALVSTGRCVIEGNVLNMDVSINLGVEGPPIGSGQFLSVVEFIDVFAESILQRRFCPSNAFLTPTGNNCYQPFVQRLTPVFQPIPITGGVNVQAYMISQEVDLYSMEATLIVEPGEPCAIVFIGGAVDDNTFLVSEPLRESGTVKMVARLSAVSLNYFEFLPTSAHVGGIGVLSTGSCGISANTVVMNVSTVLGTEDTVITRPQVLSVVERVNGTTAALTILQIQPEEAGASTETGVIVGVVVAAVVLLLVLAGITITMAVLFMRNKTKSVNGLIRNNSSNIYSTEVTTTFVTPYNLNEGDQNVADHGYETLSFEKEGEPRSPVEGSYFQPRFGVSVPEYDFSSFNRERSATVISDWEYPRSKLVYMRDIGEGQFGKVLLMRTKGIAGYPGRIPVAVKTLTSRDPKVIESFMKEAELMKKFSHPNIVGLLGICSKETYEDGEDEEDDGGDSAPLMILEFMQHGDLQSFLESNKSELNEAILLKFSKEIALAMEFLSLGKYVHRDVAARNCLVGRGPVIKIADFGLARGVHDKDYYRVAGQAVLPVRWMAPECLLYGVFTTKSDVWAYGVVLWEIMTYGEIPLENLSMQEIVSNAQNRTLQHPMPADPPELMYSVMRQCHKQDAEARPTFTEILDVFAKAQEESETQNEHLQRKVNSDVSEMRLSDKQSSDEDTLL